MPRYYCEYCDCKLTHDSPAVRKQHNQGYKHRDNMIAYYAQFLPNYQLTGGKARYGAPRASTPLVIVMPDHILNPDPYTGFPAGAGGILPPPPFVPGGFPYSFPTNPSVLPSSLPPPSSEPHPME